MLVQLIIIISLETCLVSFRVIQDGISRSFNEQILFLYSSSKLNRKKVRKVVNQNLFAEVMLQFVEIKLKEKSSQLTLKETACNDEEEQDFQRSDDSEDIERFGKTLSFFKNLFLILFHRG